MDYNNPFFWFIVCMTGLSICWIGLNHFLFNQWCCTKRRNRIRESERFVQEFFANKRAKNRQDNR